MITSWQPHEHGLEASHSLDQPLFDGPSISVRQCSHQRHPDRIQAKRVLSIPNPNGKGQTYNPNINRNLAMAGFLGLVVAMSATKCD